MSSDALKKYLKKTIGDEFNNDLFAQASILKFASEAGLEVLLGDENSEPGVFLRSLGPCETLVLRNGPGGGESVGIISTYSLPPGCSAPPRLLKVLEGTQWEVDLIVDCRDMLGRHGFIKVLIPGVDYTPEESHAHA